MSADDRGGPRRSGHDPYIFPGTDVLENKLGIHDAGELERVERLLTADRLAIRFAMTSQLESSASEIFGRLAHDNHLQGLSRGEFARSAAKYLADVNALHPFREGNGRAQREFFRAIAARAGFHLDWSRTNAKDMVRASVAGMVGDTKGLARIFTRVASSLFERDLDS